jgi:hypothetical protein
MRMVEGGLRRKSGEEWKLEREVDTRGRREIGKEERVVVVREEEEVPLSLLTNNSNTKNFLKCKNNFHIYVTLKYFLKYKTKNTL